MRIIIQSFGSYGDVFPFIALGRELSARGHEVLMLVNQRFEQITREAGLTFVQVGAADEYERFLDDPNMWSERRSLKHLLRVLAQHLPQAYKATVPYVLPGRTALIGSTLAFSARIVQERLNVPGITVHLAPSIFRSVHKAPILPGMIMPDWLPVSMKRGLYWLGDKYLVDPLIVGALNDLRAELLLPPVSRVFDRWIHAPELVIGLFPSWFGNPQVDWPMQVKCTGFPLYDSVKEALSPALQDFIGGGSRPIVFTAGTAMKHGADFFKTSVAACRQLERRGILLTPYPDQLPVDLDRDIHYAPYVPFSSLLPHCDGLVHHGGIGTTSQALKAGIPQLVRPCAYDQFDNADRIVTLGVGRMLTRAEYDVERVGEALGYLLTDSIVQGFCQSVSERFEKGDPVAESCDLIEEYVLQ